MLISSLVIPTTPGVVEVVISDNKCFGQKLKPGYSSTYAYIDVDQSGWTAFCEAMKGSSVQKLGCANVWLGPIGMKTLAETIPTIPGLVEVVISANKCLGERQEIEG